MRRWYRHRTVTSHSAPLQSRMHMYVAKLVITNLRCFHQTTVDSNPGINVILGENNAGKTALLCALRLVFDRSGRLRPDLPHFYQGIVDFTKAPTISVTATLRSSTADTIDDKALVATWLPSWTLLGKHSSATNSSFPTKRTQRSPRHLVRHPTGPILPRPGAVHPQVRRPHLRQAARESTGRRARRAREIRLPHRRCDP